jgi:uncharacterized protein
MGELEPSLGVVALGDEMADGFDEGSTGWASHLVGRDAASADGTDGGDEIATWSVSSRFVAENREQCETRDGRGFPVGSRDPLSVDPQGSPAAGSRRMETSHRAMRAAFVRENETVSGEIGATGNLSGDGRGLVARLARAGDVTRTIMRTGWYLRIGCVVAGLAGSASAAHALDPNAGGDPNMPPANALAHLPTDNVSTSDMSAASLPPGISAKLLAPPVPPAASRLGAEDSFRAGTRLYYAGDRKAAIEQLRKAAENGHPIAQWKLGKIYQSGDGVPANDAKAFEFYRQVVDNHSDEARGTPQAAFVASAFVALGSYYLKGIDNTAVRPNMARARELYTYAASIFGDADAQFNLGRLYLDPASTDRDPRQAARWLTVAAKKGHAGAQALLGQLLFSGDDDLPRHPAQGLMWLTVARANVHDASEDWIRDAQEQAFSVASEPERRKGVAEAQNWIARGGSQ